MSDSQSSSVVDGQGGVVGDGAPLPRYEDAADLFAGGGESGDASASGGAVAAGAYRELDGLEDGGRKVVYASTTPKYYALAP